MDGIKLKNNRKDEVRKYLLTDVVSCTFTFSDGMKSRVNPSPDNDVVLMKLIPRTSASKRFENSVLRNYSSVRTMNELAKRCGYDNIKTFTRHFKKSFGETPYQWMLDRKMEEVHSLVTSSDISITEIAEMYGFKSLSHLVNLYSKRYGISPHKSRVLKLPDP